MNHILEIDWIIFSLFESNRREASDLLEMGRFTCNEHASMVLFFLRVNPEETLLLDSMGRKVINSRDQENQANE